MDNPYLDVDDIEIVHLTPEQTAAAIQRELDEVGLTHAELEDQYRRGWFDSELARRLWFCLPRHVG